LFSLRSFIYAPPQFNISRWRKNVVSNGQLSSASGCLSVRTLQLDFILHDERLALVVDRLGELGRNGMMGSSVLDDQALVAVYAAIDLGFLDRPVSNVGPLLFGSRVLLLCMRRSPPLVPIIRELL
jgi:hypothetical protein